MRRTAILAPRALTIEPSLPGVRDGAVYPSDTATPVEGIREMERVQ